MIMKKSIFNISVCFLNYYMFSGCILDICSEYLAGKISAVMYQKNDIEYKTYTHHTGKSKFQWFSSLKFFIRLI